MDPRPEHEPSDDGPEDSGPPTGLPAGGTTSAPGGEDVRAAPAASLIARAVTPVERGFMTLSVIDTAAIGVSVWALVFINEQTTSDHLPLLVASLAASAVVLFSLPGLDIARSWNVIAGQFLGALAGFVAVTLIGDHPALVAGCAVALAYVLMRLASALHPPGAATAMFVALVPSDHGVRFLFFPVLAGAITITVFAWLVHLLERLLMARMNRRTPGT